jgi:PIN domain nuclease of toxin-antitoxin system
MLDIVLDASAVLAHLRGERGADKVAERLDGAAISAVNWAEVIQKLVDDAMTDDTIELALSNLSLAVIDFDAPLAEAAGRLRRTTRERGLSLGDRACLALARREGKPVLTADRAWAELDLGVEVVLIR